MAPKFLQGEVTQQPPRSLRIDANLWVLHSIEGYEKFQVVAFGIPEIGLS